MTRLKQTGYALIEILIVISIIVLFSGLSLAYFRGYEEQRKLDSATKQLVDVLSLAQKKAGSADLDPNRNCNDFQGYRVNLSSTTSYELEFNCSGTNSVIQSYNVVPGVTLSGVGSFVLFKPLSAGTNLSAPLTITVTNSTDNKCKNIQVNPVGTIEERTTCP